MHICEDFLLGPLFKSTLSRPRGNFFNGAPEHSLIIVYRLEWRKSLGKQIQHSMHPFPSIKSSILCGECLQEIPQAQQSENAYNKPHRQATLHSNNAWNSQQNESAQMYAKKVAQDHATMAHFQHK